MSGKYDVLTSSKVTLNPETVEKYILRHGVAVERRSQFDICYRRNNQDIVKF